MFSQLPSHLRASSNFHNFFQGFLSMTTIPWASALAHPLILTFRKMISISLPSTKLQLLPSISERLWFNLWPCISLVHHPPHLHFHLTSLAPNYTAVFLLKKLLITPSRKRSLYYAMESWKMHLHLILKYKIALSSQNLRIRYNPCILCIIALSFASLLITVSSPDSIYLYLDIFLLKFLFISKPSEWVLTFRFSPVTLSLHSPNIKECISLISQVLVQPELPQYLRTPYFMYLSSGDSLIYFFFPQF